MRPPRTKLIGTVALGLIVYGLWIVQCAAQTSDSIAIPKTAWERLEQAITAVSSAITAIRPTSAAAQPTTARPSPTPTAISDARGQADAEPATPEPATGAIIPTPQVYLEGAWLTEWPKDGIRIELGYVEDRMFHDGQLSPNTDGTYALAADGYAICSYHISLSPDRHKMFWVPVSSPVLTSAPATTELVRKCRPATVFSRIIEEHRDRDCCGDHRRDRDCCSDHRRDRDCCGDHRRDRDCCGDHRRDRDCCSDHRRDRDCCSDHRRDRDCCGDYRRDRDCCGDYRRDRDCCGERRKREPVVWWWGPPCDYCRDPF
jgi:hypothetical protein